ncbi:hypothetical protein GCM10028808_73480 [Spirosoma migulaei]
MWFLSKINYRVQGAKGKWKAISEQFIHEGVTYGEVEAQLATLLEKRVSQYEYDIDKIKFGAVYEPHNKGAFHKVTIDEVSVNDSGVETKTTYTHYVIAADVPEAFARATDYMKTWGSSTTIVGVTESKVLGVWHPHNQQWKDDFMSRMADLAEAGHEKKKKDDSPTTIFNKDGSAKKVAFVVPASDEPTVYHRLMYNEVNGIFHFEDSENELAVDADWQVLVESTYPDLVAGFLAANPELKGTFDEVKAVYQDYVSVYLTKKAEDEAAKLAEANEVPAEGLERLEYNEVDWVFHAENVAVSRGDRENDENWQIVCESEPARIIRGFLAQYPAFAGSLLQAQNSFDWYKTQVLLADAEAELKEAIERRPDTDTADSMQEMIQNFVDRHSVRDEVVTRPLWADDSVTESKQHADTVFTSVKEMAKGQMPVAKKDIKPAAVEKPKSKSKASSKPSFKDAIGKAE